MAFYPELKGVALDAYNRMVDELKNRAMKELGLSEDDIIVRPLRPEDLELSTPVWRQTNLTAAAWITVIDNATIDDNRFVGINGFSYQNASTAIAQLEFTRKGSVTRIWNIQAAPLQDDKTLFVDDPFTVDQNTTITMKAYALTAGTEGVVLHGVAVEKRGMVINP